MGNHWLEQDRYEYTVYTLGGSFTIYTDKEVQGEVTGIDMACDGTGFIVSITKGWEHYTPIVGKSKDVEALRTMLANNHPCFNQTMPVDCGLLNGVSEKEQEASNG